MRDQDSDTSLHIKDTLLIAIIDETQCKPTVVTEDMTSSEIKGWDSLAHVRVMLNLEARLGIEIDIDATYRMKNFGELISHIHSRLKPD